MKGFVNIDTVLEMLGEDRREAVEKYKELMLEKEGQDYENLKVIGDEAYQIMCSSKKKSIERKRLDEILIETEISIEDYALVKAGSRKRNLTEYKLQYARAALLLKYTYKEIGENISTTDSAIKDLIGKYGKEITD